MHQTTDPSGRLEGHGQRPVGARSAVQRAATGRPLGARRSGACCPPGPGSGGPEHRRAAEAAGSGREGAGEGAATPGKGVTLGFCAVATQEVITYVHI